MPVDLTRLNQPGDPVEYSWTEDDVILYALGVGAGHDPLTELQFTTESSASKTLTALSTFANIITRVARVPFGDVEMANLVHASQAMEIHRIIPAHGRARVTPVITAIHDKGSGALVTTEQRAVDAQTGEPLATTEQTVLIRGEGGFGGERGPSQSVVMPSREPDVTTDFQTRPEQALIYRLSGDRNPLHADPAFAAKGGWDRPILHGMCTYGFTGRAIVQTACGGDPARLVGMRARFTKPVWPGDPLSVDLWLDDGKVTFQTRSDATVVLDQGQALIAQHNPIKE